MLAALALGLVRLDRGCFGCRDPPEHEEEATWPAPPEWQEVLLARGEDSLLGAGGFGHVVLHPTICSRNEYVALKVAGHAAGPSGEAECETARAEYALQRRAARLTRAVPRVYGFHPPVCAGTNAVSMLMEAAQLDLGALGSSRAWVLGDVETRAPLVVHVAREVAEALDSLHAEGIVHRDVKQENIFLTADIAGAKEEVAAHCVAHPSRCGVLLGDFGLACTATTPREGLPKACVSGAPVGTPNFFTPEEAAEMSDEGGVLSGAEKDLWALGMTLLELLAPGFETPLVRRFHSQVASAQRRGEEFQVADLDYGPRARLEAGWLETKPNEVRVDAAEAAALEPVRDGMRVRRAEPDERPDAWKRQVKPGHVITHVYDARDDVPWTTRVWVPALDYQGWGPVTELQGLRLKVRKPVLEVHAAADGLDAPWHSLPWQPLAADFEDVVAALLEPDPAARYEAWQGAKARLAALAAELEVGPPPARAPACIAGSCATGDLVQLGSGRLLVGAGRDPADPALVPPGTRTLRCNGRLSLPGSGLSSSLGRALPGAEARCLDGAWQYRSLEGWTAAACADGAAVPPATEPAAYCAGRGVAPQASCSALRAATLAHAEQLPEGVDFVSIQWALGPHQGKLNLWAAGGQRAEVGSVPVGAPLNVRLCRWQGKFLFRRSNCALVAEAGLELRQLPALDDGALELDTEVYFGVALDRAGPIRLTGELRF